MFKLKTETCEDDPNWQDTKFGDATIGVNGCADINQEWCNGYGEYSAEARRACPKTCHSCLSGQMLKFKYGD